MWCEAFIIVGLFYLVLCLCIIGFPTVGVSSLRWFQKLVQKTRLHLDRPTGIRDPDWRCR
jgi:hypothetical protein